VVAAVSRPTTSEFRARVRLREEVSASAYASSVNGSPTAYSSFVRKL
jgi:hypothetical protein